MAEKVQKTKHQPTSQEIKEAILLLPGVIVTYRLFKCFVVRRLRSATRDEYDSATADLTGENAGEIKRVTSGNGKQSVC